MVCVFGCLWFWWLRQHTARGQGYICHRVYIDAKRRGAMPAQRNGRRGGGTGDPIRQHHTKFYTQHVQKSSTYIDLHSLMLHWYNGFRRHNCSGGDDVIEVRARVYVVFTVQQSRADGQSKAPIQFSWGLLFWPESHKISPNTRTHAKWLATNPNHSHPFPPQLTEWRNVCSKAPMHLPRNRSLALVQQFPGTHRTR